MGKDKEFKVIIPEEYYQILKFKQEELPGIAVVNKNLADFEPKEVFSWHCSVMLNCKELIENGMPSKSEVKILDEFGDFLDEKIKGTDKEKPNGLFLARITWNETRELIWRIYDPEITNEFLNDLIERNEYPREFDFRIDDDVEWKLSEWHLKKRK
ncbi:MAG: DUF695 domain-containing protein [Flavobacteriaceae bacterium]|nr:DUF695 domain-containing protein [Flavobacteriaceae bacterium]